MLKNQNIIRHHKIISSTLEELAEYKAIQFYCTFADLIRQSSKLNACKTWLDLALARKYDQQITAKRTELQQKSGVVQITDDGVKVSNIIEEKVHWQQKGLTSIVQEIANLGYNASQFIDISYTVPEGSYDKYPKSVLNILLPYRKTSLSKGSYTLNLLATQRNNYAFK